MDLLPALRDAQGDLAAWRRSPMRPLIENAFRDIDRADLKEIGEAIEGATAKITEFDEVKELETDIGALLRRSWPAPRYQTASWLQRNGA